MTDGGKLRTDLVLQSRPQPHTQEGCATQAAFDRVSQLGARGVTIVRLAQLLNQRLATKIVDQVAMGTFQVSADDHQVLSKRSVGEKLFDQGVAITLRFGKQQHAGSKAVDTMNDKSTLALWLEFVRKNRQSRHHPR